MRIRRLLATCLLAGAAVMALPMAAHADPGKAAAEELRECTEKALESTTGTAGTELQNALDDCHKAKSIVVPAIGELVWGAAAFLIVAVALMKFAFPMMKKTLKDREDKIRGDIEGAEAARTQAEEELTQYRAQLADANREGQRIIEEARQSAEQVRTDVIAKAEADSAELKARATEDIQLATERAQSDLQNRVKDLSIELAEKVVERNLDADTQRALIDSYIGQVGSN